MGNGVSAGLLSDYKLSPSILVISLNRLLNSHRTDLVSIVRADYLELFHLQWPEWPSDRLITGSAETSLQLAFEYVKQQNWNQVLLLGMDGTVLARPELNQEHVQRSRQGIKRTPARLMSQARWQQQLKRARQTTGVMPIILQTRAAVARLAEFE